MRVFGICFSATSASTTSVDRLADRRRVALGYQVDLVVGNPEHLGKAPQRLGVVAAHEPDPIDPGEQRDDARRGEIVAPPNMVDK